MTKKRQPFAGFQSLRPKFKQHWLAVDIGTRFVKCGYLTAHRGEVKTSGVRTIDIQNEGLLSPDEIAASLARLVGEVEPVSVCLVLPQSAAISQVIDLDDINASTQTAQIEQSIRAITGLSEGHFVYDGAPLRPFGPYRAPFWVSVAREEVLSQHLGPILAHGLRVEAVTTVGNAILASFRAACPEVENACIVDFGATQTTVALLQNGQPTHLTSFPSGGESLTQALLEYSASTDFEGFEKRLLGENLSQDPVLGPTLRQAVVNWRKDCVSQLNEWAEESPTTALDPDAPVYLCGGFSTVPGLFDLLNEDAAEAARFQPFPCGSLAPSKALTHPLTGAVLLASGQSTYQASILPRPLARMAQRRRHLTLSQLALTVTFAILVLVLLGGILERRSLAHSLQKEHLHNRAAFKEGEAATRLLRQRDRLAERIAPIVDRQIGSIEAVKTLRLLQNVNQEFEFSLVRFADRRNFHSNDQNGAEAGFTRSKNGPRRPAVNDGTETREPMGLHAFVADLAIAGDPATRLDTLGAIVMRLREEDFFANVDRLIERPQADHRTDIPVDGTYALQLTLSQHSDHRAAQRSADSPPPNATRTNRADGDLND
ncbi:MAG: hypothetical protein EA353_11275 [Puniceicoccaceae bacterium]|nr:MAG: hypothetical protein EA353_11275 [Puniceicoccaceae bacterium]